MVTHAEAVRAKQVGAVRVILFLSTVFALGFFLLCISLNGVEAFAPSGKPVNTLFALGGVYGHALGTLEVIRHTACATIIGIAALAVCDIVYARHTEARWFALHIIANLWISLLCLPGVWFMLADPLEALREGRTNHWPTSLVFSVHIYHMAFFSGLHWIDWLHHGLMVIVGAPMLVTAEVGPLMNFNNFFMCGLPGGADYAMLFAVKHGWMSPIKEKKYNSMINVWGRAPFLVAVATLAYVQFFLQEGVPLWIKCVRAFLVGLGCWNGLFFMERVVGNYHVQMYKHVKMGRSQPKSHNADYETDEHFSASVPGLGMRVVVSRQELAALDPLANEPEPSCSDTLEKLAKCE